MTSLLFLAIAVVVSVVGTLVLVLFSRERRNFDDSIKDFSDNMGALAPGSKPKKRTRRGP